ncbi:unnamed protein product [Ceutorhynchus assimilis]|uniref:Uncharacterized protein n=1 Tax=Ceutorhynchus assimilis TaxID=467358 RepID=A0A9N9MM54_9CUCU|nr:unnamed protein product [Ceutorhynchus assimilis]
MKVSTSIFIVGILAIGAVFATPLEDRLNESRLQGLIDGLINKTINNILANISEPICVDKMNLSSSNDQLNGFIDVINFKLYGIKEMVAEKLDVSLLNLNLNSTLYIKQLVLGTQYDADVTLLELVPLYGNGRVSVTLDDIDICVFGKVSTKGGISISNVTVSFNIGDGVFQVTGLLHNEDFSVLLSTIMNDNVIPFINEHSDLISKIVSPILEKLIQAALGGGSKSAELLEFQELYEAELDQLLNGDL